MLAAADMAIIPQEKEDSIDEIPLEVHREEELEVPKHVLSEEEEGLPVEVQNEEELM